MFDGRDLDEAEQLVDDWQAGIEARAAQTRELAARLGALTATARSDDELISVTVGASGATTDLVLKEGIRDQPADETARAILATMRAAQAALTEAATEATAETVGADSETGKAIIASYVTRQAPEHDD
jgi:phenylpyruvate tautomerase PptA (4-oxalocrotonate tautomerase family)